MDSKSEKCQTQTEGQIKFYIIKRLISYTVTQHL